MAGKTNTRTTRKATAPKRPKLVNDGRPKGKGGKGGTVTQHGVTTTGYQRGCRCKLCVQAASDYARKARERKAAAKPSKVKAEATQAKAKPRRAATKKAEARP